MAAVAAFVVLNAACGDQSVAPLGIDTAGSALDIAIDTPGGQVDGNPAGSTQPGDIGGDTEADSGSADTDASEASPADAGQADGAGADALTGDGSSPCASGCTKPASPCQYAVCEPVQGCITIALPDGALCDDGKACTQGSTCMAGTCVGGPATACDDASPCTTDGCDGTTGACAHLPIASSQTCDDGDPCTVETVCVDGKCAGGLPICACMSTADCAAKEDGNACNGTLYCDPGTHVCVVNPASVVQCQEDGNPCTESLCNAATGNCAAINLPTTTTCSDGAACTQGDHCEGGLCKPGPNLCCASDAECSAQDDGNLCNGTLFCNKATGLCQFNPKSVVYCPTVDDTACKKHVCEPKTGQCGAVLIAEGGACDDGNPCTQTGCKKGLCTVGVNTCVCQSNAECAAKEDGDLCNGTLYCNLAAKQCEVNPATVVACSPSGDSVCAKNTCNPKTGVCAPKASNDGADCDADGNPCTGPDLCLGGSCKVGAIICACQNTADCAAQEDGNPCNGTLYCDQIAKTCKINPATLVVCPSANDTACAHSVCNPKTALCEFKAFNENGICEADGSLCSADSCLAGACKAGINQCMCQSDADCAAVDDGNACNGKLVCDKKLGVCTVAPATVVVCPGGDDTDCLHSVCQPKTGKCALVPFNEFGSCAGDGNPCTVGDRCQGGLCAVGLNQCQCGADQGCQVFDDGNLCNGNLACSQAGGSTAIGLCITATATVIECSGGGACIANLCIAKTGKCVPTVINDGKGCNDGAACTGGDQCQNGACIGTQPGCDDGEPCTVDLCDLKDQLCKHLPTPCSDNNPCTADSCKKGEGCLHEPQAGNCDDANLCTLGDMCDKGICNPGNKPQTCDDGLVCTLDACSPTSGCVHAAASGPCSDTNPCTLNDACQDGTCFGKQVLDCNDGNPCTADPCKAGLGCVHTAQDATCTDSNPCTTGDACTGGSCTGTADVDCADSNPCTADSCAVGKGCIHTAQEVSCDDTNPCTAGDGCKGGVCLPGAATVNCDDGTPCTLDTCSPIKGCVHAAASGACNDGNACTALDQCQQGVCLGPSQTQCDDGNPCSEDNCAPSSGCVNLPKDATCSDGNPCTLSDKCAGSACKAGMPVSCDDGDFCTNDSCSAAKGCLHTFNEGPCNDGAFCTVADTCDGAGSCAGKPRDCQAEAGGPCAASKCDEANDKCEKLAYADGTACDDGTDCTPLDVCKVGNCVGVGDACGDEELAPAGSAGEQLGVSAGANETYAVQWVKKPTATYVRATDGSGSRLNEAVRLDDGVSATNFAARPLMTQAGVVYAAAFAVASPLNLDGPNPYLYVGGTHTAKAIAADGSVATLGQLKYVLISNGTPIFKGGSRALWVDVPKIGLVLCAAIEVSSEYYPFRYMACAQVSGSAALGGVTATEGDLAPLGGAFEAAATPDSTGDTWLARLGPKSGDTGPSPVEFLHVRRGNLLTNVWSPQSTWSATSPAVRRVLPRANGSAVVLAIGSVNAQRDLFMVHVASPGAQIKAIGVTNDTDYEVTADATAFDNGEVLAVWNAPSGDGSGHAILGQRWNKEVDKALEAPWVVTSKTQGDQQNPGLATLSNGDFVLAYHDNAGKVFTRRMTQNGKPSGVRLERIANQITSGDQSAVVAASQSDGSRAFVAWQGPMAGKDGYEVRGRVFDKDGKALGPEFAVNSASTDNQLAPAVASSPARFAVVWDSQGQDGQLDGVFGRVFDADGNAVTGEVPVNTQTKGIQDQAAVAMNDSGIWFAAWRDNDPAAGTTWIYGRAFDKAGNAFGDAAVLHPVGKVAESVAHRARPKVAAIPGSSEFLVVFESAMPSAATNIAVARVSVTASLLGESPWYAGIVQHHYAPMIAATGANMVVCYTYQGSSLRYMCGAVSPLTGQVSNITHAIPQAAATQAGIGAHASGAIAPMPGGKVALAWESQSVDGSGAAVQMRTLNAANLPVPLGPRVQANRTSAGDQRTPAVAWLQGGTLTAWISDGQDGSGSAVVYRVLP